MKNIVRKFPNGTVDWGTPGNRPRQHPATYYQTYKDIVESAGFKHEEYEVETEDGYLLDVYRITHDDFTRPKAPVVFL